MNRARYAPRVLEGRALLAVVCHGALVLARAVRSKSPRGSRRVRSMGRITIRKHWKCSHAICTVASATCNSHVLLHRQRLIVEVVHGVAAETVSRRRRHRTWQGAADAEGARRVEPVTLPSRAWPEYQAGSLEVLLRADATVTTTTHLSPRRPAYRGVHLFVTVSIRRKV